MNKFLILMFFLLSVVGCKEESVRPHTTQEKFRENATMMLNIAGKLAVEPSATQLNKAAFSVQASRVVACINVIKECDFFGQFLSMAIRVSKDKDLSNEDREQLKEAYASLQQQLKDSDKKIAEMWAAYNASLQKE